MNDLTDIQLIELHRAGNRRAADVLVQRYDRIVWYWARRYMNRLDLAHLEDATQYARMRLFRAMETFDPGKEGAASFATFATVVIQRAILMHIKLLKDRSQREVSIDVLQRWDDDEDYDENHVLLTDLRPLADQVLDQGMCRGRIEEALEKIDPRLAMVLQERFVAGRTLDEIGRDMCITKERVRQLEVKALKAMGRKLGGIAEVRRLIDAWVED
jgi:RNA polymerase sigma factor (sigma-70 family)